MSETDSIRVVSLTAAHRDWAIRLIEDHWASTRLVSRGVVYDVTGLPGYVALRGDAPVGLLTFRVEGDACEVMSLDSLVEGIGIGSALIAAVREAATARGCRRLWLITTNDNLPALRFYQKRGFHLVAVHPGALDVSRRLKPQIPLIGLDDIPLRDELELEIML